MADFIKTATDAIGGVMAGMVGTLFQAILDLILPVVTEIMAVCSNIMQQAFSMDSTRFLGLFPVATNIQNYLQSLGIALVVALFIMALFRNLFSGLGYSAEDPMKLAVRFFVVIALVLWVSPMLSYIFTGLFNEPYKALVALSGNDQIWGAFKTQTITNVMTNSKAMSDLSGFFDAGITKMVVSFMACVLMISITVNYFKLLIEMAERYLLANVLIVFAPLAASSSILESTMSVFKSFCRMFIGQIILLLTNAISLAMLNSAMGVFAADITTAGGSNSVLLDAILILAFLKIAQHMDNYIKDMGVNAGVTGGSMIDEIVTTVKTVSSTSKALTKGFGSAAGGVSAAKNAYGVATGAVSPGSTSNGSHFSTAAALGTMAGKAASKVNGFSSSFGSQGAVGKDAAAGAVAGAAAGAASGLGGMPMSPNAAGSTNSIGPMPLKSEPFNTGETAKTQAMSMIGSTGLSQFGKAGGGMDMSSIKSTPDGVLAQDNQGNLHGFFSSNPSDTGDSSVTPFTGADNSTYYHQAEADMNPAMGKAMSDFYDNGAGSLDAGAVKQSSYCVSGGTPGQASTPTQGAVAGGNSNGYRSAGPTSSPAPSVNQSAQKTNGPMPNGKK